MTDPAVEAAERAWEKNKVGSFHVQRVAAADEALKPIQEWHRRLDDAYALDDRPEGVLVSAVLADLAKLIYRYEDDR